MGGTGVMDPGDRREDILLDDVDRQDFLKPLAQACQKTGWQTSLMDEGQPDAAPQQAVLAL